MMGKEWKIKANDGGEITTVGPVLQLSSMIVVRDAVLAGIGAARPAISLVSHDMAVGRLVHWDGLDAADIALWTLLSVAPTVERAGVSLS